MKRMLAAAAAVCLMLALGSARAAKGTVALVPAVVVRGDEGNGPVVTDALRESLEKQGFTLLAAEKVEEAITALKVDLSRQQTAKSLNDIRKATGADWVVYPRVLSVGMGVNAKGERQTNIQVNIQKDSNRNYFYTRQVGHVFATDDGEKPVIDASSAEGAAQKLLADFYAKVK